MKNDLIKNNDSPQLENNDSEKAADNNSTIDRRKFVGVMASAVAFTIVPRSVLGGKNFIAPSDKVTLAYIGVGTQGIRELLPLLAMPQFQVVAVCDPNKEAVGYRDWGKDWLRESVQKAIK